MLEESVYRRRYEEIQHLLQNNNADFAFITPSPGYQYLTGSGYEMHERLVALIIRPNDDPQLIAPSFEVSDHQKNTWVKEILPWTEEENPYKLVADLLGENRNGFHAFFDAKLPIGIFWELEKALGSLSKVQSLSVHLNSMRLMKSEQEISMMKKAGEIIDDAISKAFNEASVGMTESEVMQIVQNEIARQGASQTFAVVQFGENSARPHARSGSTELQNGDMVLMDCGCAVMGYNTDMTRVGVVGEPTDEQKKVHSVVLRALETTLEQIKPGMACGAADGIARRVIEEENYGEYFTHRLGHGIGLEVHEPPYIVRGNSKELEPGMTHSVEPGIYMEGKFGVRIEDLVVITDNGLEVLTYTPKDLFLIDV